MRLVAECSAKTNLGVKTAFEDLVNQVRRRAAFPLASLPSRLIHVLLLHAQILATPSLYTKTPRADGAQAAAADVIRVADGGDSDHASSSSGMCAC
jgi:hypothetical protein